MFSVHLRNAKHREDLSVSSPFVLTHSRYRHLTLSLVVNLDGHFLAAVRALRRTLILVHDAEVRDAMELVVGEHVIYNILRTRYNDERR